MNHHRTIITEAQHFNVVAKHASDIGRAGTYAKPGELQAKACKRILAASVRVAKDKAPYFPVFKPGMSTADYVQAYEGMNGNRALKCTGFWRDLNTEPATMYEGDAFDFAPICEELEPAKPRLAYSQVFRREAAELLAA